MGLFDDFDIDMDDVKAASFDFEDGSYEFEISEARVQNGSKKKEDDTFFIISYSLNDGVDGTYNEWFTIAQDGEVTQRAKQSLSFLKARLIDLGLEAASLNELDPEDLEGTRGTLQLKTTKSAKGEFQNVRNVKVGESEEADEPEESDAEIKKRVQAKQADRATTAKTATVKKPATTKRAAKPVADDEDDDNPFG